jgi:iron complex outermembrane receptor protein
MHLYAFKARSGPATGGVAIRLLACAATSLLAPSLWAAEVPAGLEEIVVTATKRQENIQDTPIAVQAFSGAQLTSINAIEVSDWVHLVPGLETQDNGASGDKRYVIRGVNAAGAGTVGLYLDDVVITGENSQDGGGQAPDIMLFDMDRVEVLKGPQGTTFGSSSMTGTIRFITAKPNLTDFSGSFGAGYRQTQGGGNGSQFDAMVNLPVMTDRFAIRLAGFYLDNPGYISNQFEKDANETKVKAGRASAKLAFTDNISLSGMAMVQNTSSDALDYYNTQNFAFQPIGQPRFYQDIFAREGGGNNMTMYELAFEDKASYGTYSVTTSRFDRDFRYTRDSSGVVNAFLDLPIDGTGRSVINYPKHRDVSSTEARFASSWNFPVQLLIGGFFQNEQRHFQSHVLTADPNGFVDPTPTVLLDRTQDDTIREKTVFAELSWAITQQLKLTVGGRRYDISDLQRSDALTGFGGGAGGGPGPTLESTNVGQIGKANLSYTPIDHVLVYAQVAQGFRPGGVNDQTAAAIAGVTIPAGFGSDSLVNYELGGKTSWLDNRLVANGAVYYIDWSKIQIIEQATSGTTTFPYTGNAGRATVKGLELELEAIPLPGLQVGAYFNYNQAELAGSIPNPSQGLVGDSIPYVPKTTFTLTANYERPLGFHEMSGTVGADYTHISSRNSALQTEPATFVETFPGYETTNLRVGVKTDRWDALINLQNVFNNTSTIADITEQQGLYPQANIPNRPRTLSVTFRTKF